MSFATSSFIKNNYQSSSCMIPSHLRHRCKSYYECNDPKLVQVDDSVPRKYYDVAAPRIRQTLQTLGIREEKGGSKFSLFTKN